MLIKVKTESGPDKKLNLADSFWQGGSLRWNEEELIAYGDYADYILNLKHPNIHGSR